jgi:hypothetical protein
MKALAFFVHIEEMLKEIKPEEWEQVSECIGRIESLLAAGKTAAAGSIPATGKAAAHHLTGDKKA